MYFLTMSCRRKRVMVTLDYFGTLIRRAELISLNGKRIFLSRAVVSAVLTPSPPGDQTATKPMSPNAHLVYNALWFAHPALQASLVGIMLWRKLHRTFPVFFGYIAFQISVFAVTFPLHGIRFYTAFFYVYWATTAISVILGFRVIHEVFLDVFRPYHALRDLGSVLFKWAGLVMLMVAAVVAASTASGNGNPLEVGIMTLERSVRVIQCGLVLFLLVFSRYLGTNWRQKSFGIALGFGAFASIELSLVALNASTDNIFKQSLVSFINMTAYNLTIFIWMGYMLVKSPAREPAAHMLRPQRWEDGLSAIQHPQTPDSLIPMFESMVDRALSRTNVEPALGDSNLEEMAAPESGSRRVQFDYPPLPQRVASKS
jgi:hypothetical protein